MTLPWIIAAAAAGLLAGPRIRASVFARVWDERKAIVVTSGPETFHFCGQHLASAFTAAFNHAEQRGMCEVFVPSYGGFELKASGPRQRPAAETAPQPQPRNYGGRA